MARVTYVRPDTLPVIYNGTRLTALYWDGVKVQRLIYNGVRLFTRRMGARMRQTAAA